MKYNEIFTTMAEPYVSYYIIVYAGDVVDNAVEYRQVYRCGLLEGDTATPEQILEHAKFQLSRTQAHKPEHWLVIREKNTMLTDRQQVIYEGGFRVSNR